MLVNMKLSSSIGLPLKNFKLLKSVVSFIYFDSIYYTKEPCIPEHLKSSSLGDLVLILGQLLLASFKSTLDTHNIRNCHNRKTNLNGRTADDRILFSTTIFWESNSWDGMEAITYR